MTHGSYAKDTEEACPLTGAGRFFVALHGEGMILKDAAAPATLQPQGAAPRFPSCIFTRMFYNAPDFEVSRGRPIRKIIPLALKDPVRE